MTKSQFREFEKLYKDQPIFAPLIQAAEKAIAEHNLLIKTAASLRRQ